MGNWTTIPPWLYQNTLPDEELQAVYVREAEKKLRDIVAQRKHLQDELALLLEAESRAAMFVADARAALERYQTKAQPQAPPVITRRVTIRELPRP